MIQEGIQNKLIEIIDVLAQQLGVAKEFVWEVLVRQQYVEAGQLLVLGVISSIALVMCIKLTISGYKREFAQTEDGNIGVAMVGIVGAVITTIGGIAAFMSGVGHLSNPKYYALREILRLLGGGQ